MPAILVEVGFINNDEDNARFDSQFDETAMAIATGIDDVLRAQGLKTDIRNVASEYTAKNLSEAPSENTANALNVIGQPEENTTDNGNREPQVGDTNDNMEITPQADDTNYNINRVPQDDDTDGSNDNSNYEGYIKDVPTGENDNNDNYQLLVGIYRTMGSANYQMNSLINSGYNATIYEDEGLFQVRVGSFDTIEEALIKSRELRDRGYDTLIVIGKSE